MVAQDNVKALASMYEAFNNRDFDRCLDMVSDDMEVSVIAFERTYSGKDGFRQFMEEQTEAFPDIKLTRTNQVAAEDQVASELTIHGTHTGSLMTPTGDVRPTGRTIDYPVCEICAFKEGKIASLRIYFDGFIVLRQLGLIPEPATFFSA